MKRREFVVIPIAALGSAAILRLVAPRSILAQPAQGTARVSLRFFTAAEARIVTAAAERVFPKDASGPGATDAGVVIYIDRQLAGPYGRDKYRYTKGPFASSPPITAEHGYQGAENPRQLYRAGLAELAGFEALSIEAQVAKLTSIERTPFFALLRAHTIEGMFCDPAHGGNKGLAGWKLVGYPGPQMDNRAHVDTHYGTAYRPAPRSLEQITGHKWTPWEEERG
jgi:gluconate 2-dehydrogenase gamma chain